MLTHRIVISYYVTICTKKMRTPYSPKGFGLSKKALLLNRALIIHYLYFNNIFDTITLY